MKKSAIPALAALLVVTALFTTACFSPLGIDNIYNTSALNSIINEAEAERDATVDSLNGKDIPPDKYWVTPTAKAIFKAAILGAKKIFFNPVSQAEVDDAALDLEDALLVFRNEKKMGNVPAVDKIDLEVKIARARNEAAAVITAAAGADVPLGMYWVTGEVMAAFETAIEAAKTAKNTAASQTAVSVAAAALEKAINDFTGSRQQGTKTTGFTAEELQKLIDAACAIIDSGVSASSEDGGDIGPLDFWVSESVFDSFAGAIEAADEAINSSASNLDDAVFALVEAITAVSDTKSRGAPPDKNALLAAIKDADDAAAAVAVAETAAEAPCGRKYAGEAAWAFFNAACNNAREVYNDSSVSLKKVNDTTEALHDAIGDFIAAISDGFGERPLRITIIGLKYLNGTEILIGLYATADEIDRNPEPEITGAGEIVDETAVAELLNTNNTPWDGTGKWYVSFTAGDDQAVYISWFAVDFDENPDPEMAFSTFREKAFSARREPGGGGSPSANTITLSGTISWLDDNNKPYPRVEITVSLRYSSFFEPVTTTLYYPRANAVWSVNLPAVDSTEELVIRLLAFPDSYKPQTQLNDWISIETDTAVFVKNKSITGIVLNPGNRIPYYPDTVVPLIEDKWVDSKITERTEDFSDWYTINVTRGNEYYFWWNDSAEGNDTNTKTLDVGVSAWYSDGTAVTIYDDDYSFFFFGCDSAWYEPVSFIAEKTGSVYIRVNAIDTDGNTGTYGIVYSTGSEKPYMPIYSGSTVPLTENTWIDSTIFVPYDEDWYTISVTEGTDYYIWWNDSFRGDGTKTLDVDVCAWYEDGDIIFSGADSAWYDPEDFTADRTGVVYIRVHAYDGSYGIGTYSIMYSTDRPSVEFGDAVSLTEDVWFDGEIFDPDAQDWYTISVTEGTDYFIWWNDFYRGDDTKTLDIVVYAWYEDEKKIFTDVDSAWDYPEKFTAEKSGVVYIRVRDYYGDRIGTYGIVFNTTGDKPSALP